MDISKTFLPDDGKVLLLNNGYEIEPNCCFKFVHTTGLSVYLNDKFEPLIRPSHHQWWPWTISMILPEDTNDTFSG